MEGGGAGSRVDGEVEFGTRGFAVQLITLPLLPLYKFAFIKLHSFSHSRGAIPL